MKVRALILSLLVVGLLSLPGCARNGGTWFPKDGAPMRELTYWDKHPRPSHLVHDGVYPIADEDFGSVSKEQRK